MGEHAHRPGAVGDRHRARLRGDVVRLLHARASERRNEAPPACWQSPRSRVLLGACGGDPEPLQYGPNPDLPQPQRGLLPTMTIAEPAAWGDQRPTVPQGYAISAIATDLKIPRQTLLLPNGDILVAEGKGGSAPSLKPKDVIAGYIKAKGTQSGEGRRPFDPAARRRWRRRLRAADGLCRESQCTLRTRAGRRQSLRRQSGCAGALRLPGRPDQGQRAAGEGHGSAVGDQPPLDQGTGRQRGRPVSLRRHRLQQQHHRARHDGGGRPRDGVAGGRTHRRAQALRHRACAIRPRSPSSPARASCGRS